MVEGNAGSSVKVVFRMKFYLYYQVNGKNRKADERVSDERLKSIREKKEYSTSQRNTQRTAQSPILSTYP